MAVVVLLVAVVAGCSSSETPKPTMAPGQGLAGDWNGVLALPDKQLPVGVTFAKDVAAVTVPDQGIYDQPATGVSTDPNNITFTVPGIPGVPNFKGRYDSDTITGTFSQSGNQWPLTMRRGAVPTPPRPQEPKPPWPYKSEDVTYRSGDITIAGTLTLPGAPGPYPAVVLITGSGAQDRNEEVFGHKPFLLIADTLTKAGYAVLRTDDRGIGGTGGKLSTADYTDLSNDVVAGLTFLRGRTDIDRTRIGLLGHSEGGYLAPLVASRPDSGVAFVIMMAGPAASGSDVLLEQNQVLLRAQGASPEEIQKQIEFVSTLTTLIRTGDMDQVRRYIHDHNTPLPVDQQIPDAGADFYTSPYFASFIDYDPTPALKALRVPVLAFYGTKDLQVPPAQSEPLARQDLAADPDADVHVFDGLNHLMQPANTGLPTEYGTIETTIAPEVLYYITAWLTKRFPPAR
ncbi:alpha/beta hydrolase family protein [Nocardia sp. NPDC051570]|uniref:alpha/beta hydrolase family protein n=1 Tax=Nocardia sp. NPDC051570 TaxID=3364324 RepID=UPI0037B38171